MIIRGQIIRYARKRLKFSAEQAPIPESDPVQDWYLNNGDGSPLTRMLIREYFHHQFPVEQKTGKKANQNRYPWGQPAWRPSEAQGMPPVYLPGPRFRAVFAGSQVYGNEKESVKDWHSLNQHHWKDLIDHASSAPPSMTVDGRHPHVALMGKINRDKQHLLAPTLPQIHSAPHGKELYDHAVAKPDDHSIRLVLADHLEENGDQNSAEFFRSTIPTAPKSPKADIIRYAREKLKYSAEEAPPALPTPTEPASSRITWMDPGYKTPVKKYFNTAGYATMEHPREQLREYVANRLRCQKQDRKQAIIRFCKDRLRYALGISKTGRGLNPADSVAMYSGGAKVPGSGQMKVNGPSMPPMSGMVKVSHEAIGNFNYPANKLQHTDEIQGYDPGSPPPPLPPHVPEAQPAAQAAVQNPRLASKMSKGESLNTKDLPEATQHDFADPIAQRIGHDKKLELIAPHGHSDKLKESFNQWAGANVPASDIMDMMSVPRPHSKSDLNHPIYLTGLKTDVSRGHNSTTTTVHTDDNIGYNYYHENGLRKDANGDPYLYFGLVHHGGGGSGDKEVSMAHALYNAATAAHRNGIKTIRLHAALFDDYVGGLAWPKLGFDAPLSDVAEVYRSRGEFKKKNQVQSRINAMKKSPITFDVAHKTPDQYTLLDLLAHPAEYKKYYTPAKFYNGQDNALRYTGAYNIEHATFDTHPESRSMKLLTARLRKIEGTEGRKQP